MAHGDAALDTLTRDLVANLDAAWHRLDALGFPVQLDDPEGLWDATQARYANGESSIDELVL